MAFLAELLLYFVFIFAALLCLVSQSPVTSVLYMIFLFVLTALVWIAAGAEFVGILLIIVYVGAVAVLFLFVVMMLNTGRPEDLAPRAQRLEFVIIPLASFLLALFAQVLGGFLPLVETPRPDFVSWVSHWQFRSNAEMIGSVLYTSHAHVFILLALVLLLAMIASIVLTLGSGGRRSDRSQDKHDQLHRQLLDTVRLRRSHSGGPIGPNGKKGSPSAGTLLLPVALRIPMLCGVYRAVKHPANGHQAHSALRVGHISDAALAKKHPGPHEFIVHFKSADQEAKAARYYNTELGPLGKCPYVEYPLTTRSKWVDRDKFITLSSRLDGNSVKPQSIAKQGREVGLQEPDRAPITPVEAKNLLTSQTRKILEKLLIDDNTIRK